MTASTVAVRERPIIFSGESVRQIHSGSKTQTRRVVAGMALRWLDHSSFTPAFVADPHNDLCPYGYAGERLWVREAHALVPTTAYRASAGVVQIVNPDDEWQACICREGFDRSQSGIRWRPSIHMPRWASRLTLEISAVRVERLQGISRKDAKAEGFWPSWASGLESWDGQMYGNSQLAFRACWDSLNGKRKDGAYAWDANPYVWCLTFRQVQP